MGNNQSISNTPMILGIIGGLLGIPGVLCVTMCAGAVAASGESGAATMLLLAGLFGDLLGFICSFCYKKNPKLWGALFLVASLASGITLITFNILQLSVCILFLVAGVLALTYKKPE